METLIFGKNEYKGLTIRIEQDDDPMSPRECDNLGTMAYWHRNFKLGDDQPAQSPDDFEKDYLSNIEKSGGIILPLYLYDHSGLVMNTTGFSCPWDSGQVGWIYVTADDIRKECSTKRISKQLREQVTKSLRAEVESYSQYLSGEVYGYIIEDNEEDPIDSCWGFFGSEDVSEQALAAADYHLESKRKEKQQRTKALIKNHVPLASRASAF